MLRIANLFIIPEPRNVVKDTLLSISTQLFVLTFKCVALCLVDGLT